MLKPLGQFQVRSRGSFFLVGKSLQRSTAKSHWVKKKTSKFFQQCIPPPGSSWICEILDVKLGNQHVRLEAMKSQGDLSHLVKHDINTRPTKHLSMHRFIFNHIARPTWFRTSPNLIVTTQKLKSHTLEFIPYLSNKVVDPWCFFPCFLYNLFSVDVFL